MTIIVVAMLYLAWLLSDMAGGRMRFSATQFRKTNLHSGLSWKREMLLAFAGAAVT